MKRVLMVAGLLALGCGAVVAQQDLIKQGQDMMKANGRNMGTVLSAMAKGEKPYDQAAVDAALNQLDDTAKKLPTMYPDSTKGLQPEGDFRISPKLYEDRAGFNAAIASFAKTVSEAKASIKDLDTLKAAVPGIGKQCGGCHETFRVKSG